MLPDNAYIVLSRNSMMPKRVIIIHGWKGVPEGGWRPWLKQELEKLSYDVYVPAMPEPNTPKLSDWLERLRETIGEPGKDTYLVGHSLGCITILRYLESLEEGREIGGVVLVGGRSYSLGTPETMNFFEAPPRWESIRMHCKKFVAIHSDNDYYVPLKESETFRRNLGAKIIIKHNMGHFTGEDGVKELPDALDAVLYVSK